MFVIAIVDNLVSLFVHRVLLFLGCCLLSFPHTAYGPSKVSPSREGKGSPLGPKQVGRTTCGNLGWDKSIDSRRVRTT